MKKRTIISLFLLSILFLTSATSVFAQSTSTPSGDPNAQIGRVETFETVTWSKPSAMIDGLSLSSTGCKVYTLGSNVYSMTGVKLFTYAWNIEWCYNGTSISSLRKWRTVNVIQLGWSYKGDISDQQSGGVNQTSYWHRAQGDFCFIEALSCVGHVYPWVDQTVYGSGTQNGSAGY